MNLLDFIYWSHFLKHVGLYFTARILVMYKQHPPKCWSLMFLMSQLWLKMHVCNILPFLWYDVIWLIYFSNNGTLNGVCFFLLARLFLLIPDIWMSAARDEKNARNSCHKICCSKWPYGEEEGGDFCWSNWENQHHL